LETANILFIGDIVGEPGLKAVLDNIKPLKEKYQPDIIIANGENVAGGKGITDTEYDAMLGCGINIITTGNHVWENWKSKPLLAKNDNIIRPLNYPPGNAGKGYTFFKTDTGTIFAILNLQGRTYMQAIDCPFRAADYAIGNIIGLTKNIIVDFHADATAEKMALAWYLDGRVSAVIGTHTHVQTSDAHILPKGTGFITDTGMTGPYDSVVGMKKDIAIKRFTLQTPFKYEMADADMRLCGVYVQINTVTGSASKIESFILPEWEK
jgi:metallophosphoesterase (TIGR00282 family)